MSLFFVELGGFPNPYILAGHFMCSVLALHFFSSGFFFFGGGEQDAIQMVVYFSAWLFYWLLDLVIT